MGPLCFVSSPSGFWCVGWIGSRQQYLMVFDGSKSNRFFLAMVHRYICMCVYSLLFWRDGEVGGVLIIMHGRSRMTIDSRIPTMPGRSPSGFHRPGRHR